MKYIFDFTCLDDLDSLEIGSILNSNRISWNTRKLIKTSLACVIIKEYIPIIGITIIGNTIMDIYTYK